MKMLRTIICSDIAWQAVALAALAAVAAIMLLGCAGIPVEIEACLDHPKYGRICATVREGRVIIHNQNLDPDVLLDVYDWIREQVQRNRRS